MAFVGIRDDHRRQHGNRPVLIERLRPDKESFPVVTSTMPYSSMTRTNIYGRSQNSIPLITHTNVASLAKNIESSGMNLTTRNTYRALSRSRYNQASPERPIKTNLTTTQRARLSSQDRTNLTSNSIVSSYTTQPMSSSKASVDRLAPVPQTASYKDNEYTVFLKTVPSELVLRNGGLSGLQNLGNTCFMNSVLQCLSNTKPLLLFCLQDDLDEYLNTTTTSVMQGVLMTEYASLIRKMWLSSERRSIVDPSSFKETIGKFAPRFIGYLEQDAQEFLRYLLQGLSEDVNRVRHKPAPMPINETEEERMRERDRAKTSWERCLRYESSLLVDIFAGQLKSTLRCSYCHYESITFDMFWDLSIPIPRDKSSATLQACIQLFMGSEELSGDEEPMCTKCKQKRPCTKKLSIQKCPEILVLHLKRFSQTLGRTKLDTHIDFPITNLRFDSLIDVISESYEGPSPVYNLFGVSSHSGTIYTGHYIAQCKHPFTHEWHEFNDSSVHLITDTSRIISSDSYVLFYERKKL